MENIIIALLIILAVSLLVALVAKIFERKRSPKLMTRAEMEAGQKVLNNLMNIRIDGEKQSLPGIQRHPKKPRFHIY